MVLAATSLRAFRVESHLRPAGGTALHSTALRASPTHQPSSESWINRQAASRTWVVRETAPAYAADTEFVTTLGEEIMTLAAHLNATTYRLLTLIAEFDRLQGWKLHGFSSCAEWLAYSTGQKRITASERVRVARALTQLPKISAAMARGELSFSQVRAITRVADEESEQELLEHARSTSADGLERLTRSWRRLDREDEAALERRRHESRCLSIFPDDQGMHLLRGRVDPEVGALVMRAIEAASDALYQGSVPETTPEQRRADALALLVERAMAVGFEDRGDRGRTSASGELQEAATEPVIAHDCPGTGQDCGPGGEKHARSLTVPTNHNRSERYMVVLHVDAATLEEGGEPGRSELEDGTRVSAETSRRLACDASLVRVTHDRSGKEIQVAGRTRSIPPRLRRALEVRDRGCRFPGCGSRFTHGHHIRHWADGGPTRLENLVLLCGTHHRLLHEGGFSLKADPQRLGRPIFYSPRGIRIPDVPPRMTINGRPLGESNSEPATGAPHPTARSPHPTAGAPYPPARSPHPTAGSPYPTAGSLHPAMDAPPPLADAPRPATGRPRWEADVPLAVYLKALETIA